MFAAAGGRTRAICLTASTTLLLSACSGSHGGTRTATAPRASTGASGCVRGSGFGLSVVPGTTGSATPIAAAKDFVRQGGVPGYGSPDSQWQVGTADSDGRVTVSDGPTELYAVQLPDKSWVIASGDKCG